MTEEEWLESTSVQRLLQFLDDFDLANDRKFRLFACACCHRIWNLLPDNRSRDAVGVAERFADGFATREELRASYRSAREVSWEQRQRDIGDPHQFVSLAASDTTHASGYSAALSAVIDASWNPVRDDGDSCIRESEQAPQTALLRDIFGNPFRPMTLDPAWLTSDVTLLAQGIYTDRAFDRMPILADALQDAGCDNDDILNHCRDTSVAHVRGCWVVDLLTGRE